MSTYTIQVRQAGRAWSTRWEFDNEGQAAFYYSCLRTFGKYRKRVLIDGKVFHSQVNDLPWGVN